MARLPLALPFALLLLTGTAQADPKLGVVNVQQVMEAVPEWGAAVKVLKTDLEKRRAKLEAEQAALQKKKEQLDAKRTVTDPSVLAKEEQQLLAEAQRFHQGYLVAQQEIAQRENRLKEAMLQRIERVVFGLAKNGEYTYIFESGAPEQPNVLYTAPGLDLTKQVIEAYQTQFKGKPLKVE